MLNPNGHSRRSGGLAAATAIAIVALFVGACGSESDTDAASPSTPVPTIEVVPTTPVPSPTTRPTPVQSPTTPSPTTTPTVPVAGPTAEDFVGVWALEGSPYVIEFDADGTYRVGVEDQLDAATVESGDWRLEGTEFIFDTSFSACPGILDRPGRYEVEMLDDDNTTVQWTVIDDPCEGRKTGLASPWTST